MEIEIKHRYTKEVIYSVDCEDLKSAVVGAAKKGACLRNADLGGANLRGANLEGANLLDVYLGGANFGGANLEGANLLGAYLRGANLGGADLGCADLGCANLRGANLRGANLRCANLRGANLRGVYLGGAEGYVNQHDIMFEVVRRIKKEEITKSEWELLGVMAIHRPCWDTIIGFTKAPVMRMLKRLETLGFGDYLKHYKTLTKRNK